MIRTKFSRSAHFRKTLAVVGAGVIGAEYAGTFAALGVEVNLIDGRDSLLSFLDREISQSIEQAMKADGVNFIWKEKVLRCDAPANGKITLTLTSGATIAVDDVLVAAGRQSNTAASPTSPDHEVNQASEGPVEAVRSVSARSGRRRAPRNT